MNRFAGTTYLVAGSAADVPTLLKVLAEGGIDVSPANPDFYIRTYSHFGIDEALELRERASSRAMGEHRTFVLVAASITSEAQNALLKTLEEPPADASFIIMVPSPSTLLSTVRSRAQTLSIYALTKSVNPGLVNARDFLKALPAKRIEMLKPLLEKGDDDRRDMGALLAFLAELEKDLAGRFERHEILEGIQTIYTARQYSTDKGALVKPLLESVALIVPVI